MYWPFCLLKILKAAVLMTKFVSKSAKNILEEADTGIRNAGPIIQRNDFFYMYIIFIISIIHSIKVTGPFSSGHRYQHFCEHCCSS